VAGRRARLRVLEDLRENDECMMSRDAWIHFAQEDRAWLERLVDRTGDA